MESNNYQSISTNAVRFTVRENEKIDILPGNRKISVIVLNRNTNRIIAGIVTGLVLIVLIYWIQSKKDPVPKTVTHSSIRPDAKQCLTMAMETINDADNTFYINLYQGMWSYLTEVFKLEGSNVNKSQLIQAARKTGISVEITGKIEAILSACETVQFTKAIPAEDKHRLLESAHEVIDTIEKCLF